MHLAYEVSKTRQGKTTKTKKCINPNLIFTTFSVFCDKSPGVVCKDLCDWIQSNLEKFKSHCFMGMASRDLDFENCFRNLKWNDTEGDEFCLNALCQAFQCHALVVTSTRIWTTIPTFYNKSETEVQMLCDVHSLFVCKDTYACLSPKFERKKEVSIGELQLVRQQSEEAGLLSKLTDKTVDKEQNIQEIKEEANEEAEPSATNEPPETESVQHEDQLGLVPFLLCQN